MNDHHYSKDRDNRVKETAEVFTPNTLIQKMLDDLGVDWNHPPQDKKFIDPTCGSGNFLVALADRGIPVHNIYGVDLMGDNIDTTKKRLRECFQDNIPMHIIDEHLERNIIQGNALDYHYDFHEYQPPFDLTAFLI